MRDSQEHIPERISNVKHNIISLQTTRSRGGRNYSGGHRNLHSRHSGDGCGCLRRPVRIRVIKIHGCGMQLARMKSGCCNSEYTPHRREKAMLHHHSDALCSRSSQGRSGSHVLLGRIRRN